MSLGEKRMTSIFDKFENKLIFFKPNIGEIVTEKIGSS